MNVIVIGCGRVGAGLAYRLQHDGDSVTVVDVDPISLERLGPGFAGRRCLGSALDRRVLEDAGLAEASAVAAVTGSDELNAVVSRLAARRFGVPRVVARIYEPRQAGIYRRLGVLTISPVEWGIGRLSSVVHLKDLSYVAALGEGRVQLFEASAPLSLAGRPSRELEISGETRVVAVSRSGRTLLAGSDTVLEAGDVVSVAVVAGAEGALQKLLQAG